MPYAIDFGTSNTVITRWNAVTQQPETLAIPGISQRLAQNPSLIPSLLYAENAAQGKVTIGQEVRDRGLDISQDSRFFRNFKRGIGTEVQGFLPELDGQVIRFEQVGEWYLTQIINQLKTTDPEIAESIVFTVPVDSFEAYRLWLGQICESLDINQVRMIDEPTAAALGYGFVDRQTLLVVDFGGGTLDLSIVQTNVNQSAKPTGFILKWGQKSFKEQSGQQAKTARVIAKAGQNLGGSDLDNWLVDHFVNTQGFTATPLISRLAERLKIQLSLFTEAQEVFFDDERFESYDLSLTRSQFEQILSDRGFFTKLDESMEQVLQQARRQGLAVSDIDAVLLVGGTVQIPAVQNWVKQYFDERLIRCEKPFEAIAQGALQLSQGIELKDFLYHGYGIRYWDRRQNRHNWHPLIKAGQPYPMENPVELVLGASLESQPSIELIVGELGAETVQTEVYFDGDRLVTRNVSSSQTQVQALNDKDGSRSIAELDPPGSPGSDRIKVQFMVDRDRFLRITVEDLLTARTLVEDQAVVQLS
ncbi:heat shock protein 70 [Leptolyngbya boryana NIES-2135]|jgi:molecular chaperone DnaK (HSP70)|uniref:Heat shock protein 70 n=1 Tax=Leptolyngbya boryana NIES-2135 TaxID=1973484 RepID=A0A1Z4JEV5_LEPBY|nr:MULTISPECIES: Hsp70 family protein [Leptolyngbya]BAY55193.1 heat shock protein 70 [Leptolyngbya boryana NIES-2135]MBD2369281.1 Hsp70 family protein [Leptolyngbya sp. FACHB-161]MBD2375717.1 Hsp70 family protein [Leptolyngbya sp. FACHB-238]MBD2401066.1 Hsp70 family protein [Leptolyngbya sp. FACHB-239]MBD2406651.1 Hsp70 family protein [Leptolyngbya sp. FACHB-402]